MVDCCALIASAVISTKGALRQVLEVPPSYLAKLVVVR